MKVLQINTVVSYGSTGRICRDIADTLTRNGHDCIIAYGRGEDIPDYKTIKIGNKIDNYIHFSKSYFLDRHGFGSKKATINLIKQIDSYSPDIIQLHNLHGYYLNIEILFKYLNKKQIPVVWLLHDEWVISGGPASFSPVIKNGELLYSKSEFSKKEYPKTWSILNFNNNLKNKKELFTSLNNMIIVTPSVWLKDIIKSSFLKKYPVKVIYNGIDTQLFKPEKTDIREKYNLKDKKILLAVASVWTPSKGLEFIKDLPQCLSENYQIVVIGINNKLRRNLPDSIIAISRTNSIKELIGWYSTADILINPTLFDNFPTVNIEALACGTPIITYETGGSPEAIDAKTGISVPKNNQNKFLEFINIWPRKTNEIIKNCRDRSKYFDKEKQYNQYIKLYTHFLIKIRT